jgi:hypothetical protein
VQDTKCSVQYIAYMQHARCEKPGHFAQVVQGVQHFLQRNGLAEKAAKWKRRSQTLLVSLDKVCLPAPPPPARPTVRFSDRFRALAAHSPCARPTNA